MAGCSMTFDIHLARLQASLAEAIGEVREAHKAEVRLAAQGARDRMAAESHNFDALSSGLHHNENGFHNDGGDDLGTSAPPSPRSPREPQRGIRSPRTSVLAEPDVSPLISNGTASQGVNGHLRAIRSGESGAAALARQVSPVQSAADADGPKESPRSDDEVRSNGSKQERRASSKQSTNTKQSKQAWSSLLPGICAAEPPSPKEVPAQPPRHVDRKVSRANTEISSASLSLANLVIPPLSPIWEKPAKERSRRPSGLNSQGSIMRSPGSLAYMMTTDTLREGGPFSLWNWKVPWSPYSASRLVWDIAGMVIITFDLLMLPLQVFDPPIQGFQDATALLTLLFWTVDIILSFLTGYQVRGLVEYHFSKVAKNYLKTWFLFDVFVVGSDWFVTFHDSMSGYSTSQLKAGKAIRFLRMMRLGRLFKLRGTLKELIMRVRSQAFRIVLGIGKLLLFIMFVNHCLACGWFGVGKLSRMHGADNWIDEHKILEDDIIYQYMTSLHWSWTQFTPASMEVVPTNSPERIYTVCTLLFAMVTFSSFVSSITNAMTQLRNLNADREHNHMLLRQYMMENDCSVKLASRIWAFIDTIEQDRKSQRKREQDVPLLAKLPQELRYELADSAYMPIIGKHPFFQRFSQRYPDFMHKVYSEALVESSIGLGHELFDAGKQATHMIFIVNGQVSYWLAHFSAQEELLEPGQWMCEAALWLDFEHCGRAVATLRSDLISIRADKFANLIQYQLQGCASEVCEYAAAFFGFFDIEENKEDGLLTDTFADMNVLKDLSTSAFGSPEAAKRLTRTSGTSRVRR